MAKILITVILSVLLTWGIQEVSKFVEIKFIKPDFISSGAIMQFKREHCPAGWSNSKEIKEKDKGIIICIKK